jgi:hypothetical protein
MVATMPVDFSSGEAEDIEGEEDAYVDLLDKISTENFIAGGF